MLELDWLPVRTDKNDPLVLCIAGADSSFRLIQVNMYASHFTVLALTVWLRFVSIKELVFSS